MDGRRYRLTERRKAVGLTQERLAELLGVDRSNIVRWERAESTPQPWNRPGLARALQVSPDELSALLADIGQAPPPADERLAHVLARPSTVDLIAAAQLREQIQQIDQRYEHTPSTLLLGDAGQLHGQTFTLRQAAAGRVRRELWAAELESATLMGVLVWDASQRRDHAAALTYFDQAITAARQTRDLVGEAHAELRKSYLALYGASDPAHGLALARRAAALARRASHVIAGLAMLHVGEAHAMLGHRRPCDRALGTAETHFAHIKPDDPAGPLHCPSQHDRLAGSCWLTLGEPAKAVLLLEQARRTLAERNKSTAIVLGNLARASIRQRSIDAATAHLTAAIEVVEHTRGGGGLNVVFTAARELRPWRDEPAVQDVSDRLLALMTAA